MHFRRQTENGSCTLELQPRKTVAFRSVSGSETGGYSHNVENMQMPRRFTERCVRVCGLFSYHVN